MKICITGSHGLLGQAISHHYEKSNIEVVGLSRDFIKYDDIESLVQYLQDFGCIIHAAANTNVEECEVNPFECYKDNTLLTEFIAYAAHMAKVKMVYISSTGIYGNHKQTPYHEYDDVHPTTHHHKSKFLGENAVLKYSGALVVRTGWLFGGRVDNKKNFVVRRIEEALTANGEIYSNAEQFGSPTYVVDLARFILELLNMDAVGVWNCVCEGHASRLEYVEHIFKYAKINIAVKPVPAAAFQRKAPVSNNEMAINLKAMQCGVRLMPSWKSSLETYVKEITPNLLSRSLSR